MNKETIPEDAKRAAATAHAGWVADLKAAYLPTVREQEFFFLRHVEAAILAERERCAKIAERDGSSHSATFAQQTPEWHARVNSEVRTADRIADAIRKPTP